MATTNLMANSISPQTLTVQAPGLLHSDQARSESADSDDHVGGILPRLSWTIPDCRLDQYAGWYAAGRQRDRNPQSMDGTGLGWPNAPHRIRPLPSGRLSGREAFLFGILLSVAGGLYLAITVNLLSAFLAVSTLLSYLLIYTPLKRKTPLCTLLGAFPGAMPTLIGWAGASAGIDRQAWYLFSILFLWQFPHFLAIALMYRDDYSPRWLSDAARL